MSPFKQQLIYRIRYWKRVVWRGLFGRCHRCGYRLNYTANGRGICTNIYCL